MQSRTPQNIISQTIHIAFVINITTICCSPIQTTCGSTCGRVLYAADEGLHGRNVLQLVVD